MHDDMFWLPIDPRDTQTDGWATDPFQFYWACNALYPPPGGAADSNGDSRDDGSELMKQFVAELESVNSPLSCWRFNNRWSSN